MFTPNQLNTLTQRHTHINNHLEEKRYLYLGILSDYQIISKDLTQQIVYTKLNPYQHFLFKRVLHGLNVFSKDEVEKMHWDKKRRIKRVWKRAQDELNLWKQTLCNKLANEVLSIFTRSTLIEDILKIDVSETDKSYINKMTFKDLGIKYEDVIIFFISKGLLPNNFLQLKCK